MKKEIKYLLVFISKTIFQWATLLLLLPTLYDLLHTYFPEPIKSFEFSNFYKSFFIASAVFVAIYQTWRKEHLALQSLQSKKTKFTVTPEYFKIRIDEHLKAIDKQIKILEGETPTLPSAGIFGRLASVGFRRHKTQESNLEYIQSLKDYKDELRSFYNKSRYLVGIFIKLESNKFDEKISVEFILKTGSIASVHDLNCPWLPSDPAKDIFSFLGRIDTREREMYRTNLEYSTKSISCNLRDLKKGRPILLINEGIYIDSKSSKLSFELFITSKYSDGLQEFSFERKVSNITEHKDISELEAFDKKL